MPCQSNDEGLEVVNGEDRDRSGGLVVDEVDAEFGAADVELDEFAGAMVGGGQTEDIGIERGCSVEIGAA